MRTVTSMRGRPSSSRSITSRRATRRDISSQTGRTPSSAKTSAMSSPDVRIALVPHTRQADAARVGPVVVAAVALDQRLGHRLPGLPGEPGRDGLGVDGVEVAAGRQHVDQPAQRRPGRPGRDEAAVEGVQHARDLVGGAVEPGHDLLGREPQHPLDLLGLAAATALAAERADSRGRASRRLGSARGPGHVGDDLGAASGSTGGLHAATRAWASASTSSTGLRGLVAGPGPRAGRAGSARRPTSGGRAASRARGPPARRPAGRAPSTCRPSRICTSLISQSQPSTCSRKSSKPSSCGRSFRPRSWSSFAACISVQICWRIAGQLRRVERGDVGVLVEQLLEPGDVAVGLGARHRRDEVVDERGVRAALGLRPLPRVVDQERVDQREGRRARRRCRSSRSCPASCPAATPGCRACPGARSRRRRSRPRPAARRASGRRPGSGASGGRSGSW